MLFAGSISPVDWWTGGVATVAAIATTAAAVAAWKSANAARDTADAVRAQREDEVRERIVGPVRELQRLLAEYSVFVFGLEDSDDAKAMQLRVRDLMDRHSLDSRFPKVRTFAEATKDQQDRVDEAKEELDEWSRKYTDEGSIF